MLQLEENKVLLKQEQSFLSDFPTRRWHLEITWAAFGLVYLLSVNSIWIPVPDSALYLGLAKSLANGQGYQFNGQPNNWVPPGLPIILAGLYSLFGESYFSANLFMALTALAGGLMIYLSLSLLDDKRMAFAVLVATLVCNHYYRYSHMVLTDVPFVPIFYGILYCGLRAIRGSAWWLLGVVLISVVGITIRLPGLTVLGPLAVAIAVQPFAGKSFSRRMIVAAVLLLAILATAIFWYINAKQISAAVPYAQSVNKYASSMLLDIFGRLGAYLFRYWEVFGKICTGFGNIWYVGILFMAFAVAGMIRLWRRGKPFFAIVVVLFAGILIVVHRPNPLDRYLIPVVPLLLYAILEGILWTTQLVCRYYKILPSPRVYLIVATLAGFLAICSNGVYGVADFWRYAYKARKAGSFEHNNRRTLGVVEILKDPQYRDVPVLAELGMGRIFHYLSGHELLSFPLMEYNTAEDADGFYRIFLQRTDAKLVIVRHTGEPEFGERIRELFLGDPNLKLVYRNRRFLILERMSPTTMPTNRFDPYIEHDEDESHDLGSKKKPAYN